MNNYTTETAQIKRDILNLSKKFHLDYVKRSKNYVKI